MKKYNIAHHFKQCDPFVVFAYKQKGPYEANEGENCEISTPVLKSKQTEKKQSADDVHFNNLNSKSKFTKSYNL